MLPYNPHWQLRCVKIGIHCSYAEFNQLAFATNHCLWLSPPPASIRHPQRVALSPITEPDRESQVFGEPCFRTSGGMGNASLSPRGHLCATITLGPHTSSHPVAGSTFVLLMSVRGVLATQISGRIPPWRPAQRCQSRLSGTSLWSRPTLNIAFKTYLSW